MNYPTGTHLLMLIADPVAHVRAAQFVNPIFEKKGLDAFLVPVHVRSAELADVVPRLGKLGNVRGLIITIPHKERMARLCSELGPNAKDDWRRQCRACRARRAAGWRDVRRRGFGGNG